ncbi:MAG: cupredoxin domain-containing protein [Acidimicrobiales bacterium]
MYSMSPPAVSSADGNRQRMVVVAAGLVALVLLLGLGAFALGARRGPSEVVVPAHRVLVEVDGLRFRPDPLQVAPGLVELTFTNDDAITHTFTVEALGVDVVIGSGETATAQFEVERGSYDIVCTIPGHEEAGMRARLRAI